MWFLGPDPAAVPPPHEESLSCWPRHCGTLTLAFSVEGLPTAPTPEETGREATG